MPRTFLWAAATIVCASLMAATCAAAEDDVAAQLERAKQRLAPEYTLAYKLAAGEEQTTKVVHLVTVETTIKGVTQTAKTRSVSTKRWRVTDVDASGNITFVHSVDHVDMWQSVSGREEVRYNSDSDDQPPPGYEQVAKSVGMPLATVTMDRFGRVIGRQNAHEQFNPGIGELTIPLPPQPVKIGNKWTVKDEVRVRLDDRTVKRIATQQVYTLASVETGVATIAVETQVLTPVDDPRIESQIVQRMQKGTIKFDLEAGRLIRKQMDLDEQVIGFNGPNSNMQYLARFTEEPVTQGEVSARRGTSVQK